jgi:hypothetical protein
MKANKPTSQGLIDLLLRHGVKPTYDSKRDIELGRLIMGKPYEGHFMTMIKGIKLVCGVGINDADYVTQPTINGKQIICVLYQTWRNMILRCYSEKLKKLRPTYIGCIVCDEWLTFSNFKKWMETKEFHGKELDKDLKVLGNKIYSPINCMFVSSAINKLLTDSAGIRGIYPQGLGFNIPSGKYIAYVSINGKLKNLGRYTTIKAAELAYLTAKHEIVLQAAKDETDQEVSEALYMQAGLILDKHNTLKQGSEY